MHITRLRLLGFKSFVEPADLLIERGLTGVVGPNGCGKSNLLEALRWVMGETSYKNMRASSMEDVIFSGTMSRPARNIAEVAISLDNHARTAPAAFNDDDTIEISRRIERDSGSDYRINGRLVRARDVQLLFADASTGARSPALVQQGRIGEIISAKPSQRRMVLEEAAGISGLHSRRHEAEIKLRAAEDNLLRLQDIVGQMDSRMSGLKRQVRQVKRYREISRELERQQAMLHYINWSDAKQLVADTEAAFEQSLGELGEKTAIEANFRQLQAKAAQALPQLRQQEVVAAAVLQRISIEVQNLEKEQRAHERRKQELQARTGAAMDDLEREQQQLAGEREHQAALTQERRQLEDEEAQNADRLSQARAAVEQVGSALQLAESNHLQLSGRLSGGKAQRNALQRQLADKRNSLTQAQQRRQQLQNEHAALSDKLRNIADFNALEQAVSDARNQLDALIDVRERLEQQLEQTRGDESVSQRQLGEARAHEKALQAQIGGLEKLLPPPGENDDSAVLETIKVTPGYETALGAALGDDLEAPLSAADEASLCWRDRSARFTPLPLPDGCIRLDRLVQAPAALSPRLLMTGIIERGEGDELQLQLQPGQRLVSVEGDLWRWDGFTARADAPTAAARRLAAQNQLEALRGELQQAANDSLEAEQVHQQARAALSEASRLLNDSKAALNAARRQQEQNQQALDKAQKQAASERARLEALYARQNELDERLQSEQHSEAQLQTELEALQPLEQLTQQVAQSEQQLQPVRSAYHEGKAGLERLQLEADNRRQRLQNLAGEDKRLAARLARGVEQIKTLQQRLQTDRQALEALDAQPQQAGERRQQLLNDQQQAETRRTQAADQLAEAENALREIDRSLAAAQQQAADCREQRARCETRLEGARERLAEQVQMIASELDCTPADCLQKAEHATGQLPLRENISRRVAKLQADRERLGSINLRADTEAEELAGQIDEMNREQEDLTGAIATLRTAISGLNREGRKRLMSAFEEINAHFEKLFSTLFGGGQARLELIESDDPLQAGLEIIASPPGKKPQVLTLLSGGEKALTALSLIFAVFLTNPAPICVLDEVDAPLDDANVERFCTLMDEMTRQTETRFLIITHHPATMARMDRLFGVTMAEKGVSQLVSVDLGTAEQYRESA